MQRRCEKTCVFSAPALRSLRLDGEAVESFTLLEGADESLGYEPLDSLTNEIHQKGEEMATDLTADTELGVALESLARTPESINTMLMRLPEWRWTAKTFEEEWSFVENICHLRDLESEGYAVRIARILEEEKPFLPDFDGSRVAIERNYIDQDARQALSEFTTTRANNVARLRGLDAGSLDRAGTFQNTGVITLRKLIGMINEHDQQHLGDLARLSESLAKEG